MYSETNLKYEAELKRIKQAQEALGKPMFGRPAYNKALLLEQIRIAQEGQARLDKIKLELS